MLEHNTWIEIFMTGSRLKKINKWNRCHIDFGNKKQETHNTVAGEETKAHHEATARRRQLAIHVNRAADCLREGSHLEEEMEKASAPCSREIHD